MKNRKQKILFLLNLEHEMMNLNDAEGENCLENDSFSSTQKVQGEGKLSQFIKSKAEVTYVKYFFWGFLI